MTDGQVLHRGACLCGAIRFTVEGDLPGPDACHCSMCRKASGHYWASTDLPEARVRLEGVDKIRWYQSSAKVRRGFCSVCGSNLFWKPVSGDMIAIAMGAFETPTGTHLAKHIFVADKGDYYDLADGVPQRAQ